MASRGVARSRLTLGVPVVARAVAALVTVPIATRVALPISVLMLFVALAPADSAAQTTPRLGRPVSAADAARQDIDVFPDGRGLPPGRGSVAAGTALYAQHCAACHGAGGRGASAEELAGGSEPLTSPTPDKTIGLYWPHATTLFDFIRRAKPMAAPGSLSADEVYALAAYLLWADGVVAADVTLDAKTLPRVRMPNRDGFVGIDAQPPR